MPKTHLSEPLTDKREAFAREYAVELKNQTDAAAAAGYSDPNAEIARLMRDPKVIARIIDLLRGQALRWQHLVAKCKRVLDEGLDAVKDIRTKDGTYIASVVDTAARLEAASLVLRTLKKGDGNLLADAADAEDAQETRAEAARRLLKTIPERPEPKQDA
jgi:phage terminase small subunit